jgi:type IV pilus assembly protein PilA
MIQKAYERLRAVQEARLRGPGAEGAEGELSAESGFTLIELMVVLLIMGILMAIAIPTFLGVTGSAHDKAAQSDLTNALTTAKSYLSSNQSYAGFDTTIGNSDEPSLAWETEGSAVPSGSNYNAVSVITPTSSGNTILIVAASAGDGGCWAVLDTTDALGTDILGSSTATSPGPGTWYGVYNYKTAATTCDATNALSEITAWAHTWPASV